MTHNHKATKTTSAQIQSPTARAKLSAQARPYFVKVADAAWVGYRKPLSGPGSWVARKGVDSNGNGWEKTLWQADDDGLKADGVKVLSFWQARTEVQKLAGQQEDRAGAPDANHAPAITLDEALTSYESALRKRGADVYNAKQPRRHLSGAMLAKPLTLLTKNELERWRDGLLEKGLAPSSVNRIMNRLRAALTDADTTRTHIWRDGLKSLPDATEANNVVIEDEATAQAWVAEAYALDHHFGLLTHTLGETGARPSQAARLRIRDLVTTDMSAPRLMMPRSGKGGTRHPGQRKVERYAVAISPELARLLKAAAKGRPSNALLLLRSNGKPWESDINKANHYYGADVRRIVSKIGLDPDEYGMYSFRHTSITRMLLKGTPTAIVARAHDTSEPMIRSHYAASILDHSDGITRQTLPSLGPAAPAASNVVPLAKGRG
jgi:integrase